MDSISGTDARHPVLACADQIDTALATVADVDPMYMTTPDKAEALITLARLQSQLAGLNLRLIAASGDVAEQDASRNVGTWLGPRTRTDTAANTAAHALATDLTHWTQVGAGLTEGSVNLAQAKVIVRALNALGHDIAPDLLHRAEAHLVAEAAHFTPQQLKRLGDKILEVIAPADYEDEERKKLEEQQRRANAATRLNFRKRGDGSTDITARVPDSVAARLKAYLEAFTNPRRDHDPDDGPITDPATGQRIRAERRRGHAFCALLEALDPTALPIHGGTATTLVVVIDWNDLKNGTGAATLPDGTRISVGETRRLACTAGILPAVLGSASEVLDLGRLSRLFKPPQRRALGIEHPTCRAEGCTVPAAWCHAHHFRDPWCHTGRTDLKDGKLLCSWHHNRAHDTTYDTEHLPDGGFRFHKRT